jgi:hypothetical protein
MQDLDGLEEALDSLGGMLTAGQGLRGIVHTAIRDQ